MYNNVQHIQREAMHFAGISAGVMANKYSEIIMHSLTDTQLRRLRPAAKPYKVAYGRGLYIEVRPTGSRLWRYRYRIAGRENIFAIGGIP